MSGRGGGAKVTFQSYALTKTLESCVAGPPSLPAGSIQGSAVPVQGECGRVPGRRDSVRL